MTHLPSIRIQDTWASMCLARADTLAASCTAVWQRLLHSRKVCTFVHLSAALNSFCSFDSVVLHASDEIGSPPQCCPRINLELPSCSGPHN